MHLLNLFLKNTAVLYLQCCMHHVASCWGGGGGSLVSMALVVWPCCSRSSLRLWGGVWLLFVRLSLLNGTPVSPNTGFLHKRIHVAISLCTTNTFRPTPPGLVPQLPVEWRVAAYSGLLYKTPPPTRVKAIEEQLGRLLFWHSLYVLLIGANWHREAPLFRCIIPPSFARGEKRAQTKGRGKREHGSKRWLMISLRHPHRQAAPSDHYYCKIYRPGNSFISTFV